MKFGPKQLFLIIGLILILMGSTQTILAQNQTNEKVDSIEVQLKVNGQIYEGLQERIEFSIERVGEKILLSQSLSILKQNQATVTAAIKKVFSKVLTGFRLESVDLSLSNHTKIFITLTPLTPVITNIKVNLAVQKLSPDITVFTKEIAAKIETELNQVFIGLPVASFEWSEGIFNLVANYILERELPGFQSNFVLKIGPQTELDLTLIPQEPVVQTVKVNYRTKNFPVALIKLQTKQYQAKFDILKGVPVEFLVHYQPQLEKYLNEYLNNYIELQKLGLTTNLGFEPGSQTQVKLTITSQVIHTDLAVRFFMNDDTSFANLQAYFGYQLSDYELFTRFYWGDCIDNKYTVGCAFLLPQNITGGFEYGPEQNTRNLWFYYPFERGDYFKLSFGLEQTPNEAVVGIYLNDHANFEFADYGNLFGVQFMFHF